MHFQAKVAPSSGVQRTRFARPAASLRVPLTPDVQLEASRDLALLAANMCVVFALGLLERVLRQLKDEKVIRTDGCTLSHLMLASQMSGLPWKSYDLIDRIRIQRNETAHKQLRLSEEECGKIVGAIRDELQSWAIITR